MNDTGRKPHCADYKIVTFKEAVLWNRADEETWMFNPVTRYVLNADQLKLLSEQIDTISDLKGSKHYKPLISGSNLRGKSLLIERYRERGIGDLLFLTGPMAYFHHMTAGTCKQFVYALADRGQILNDNPALAAKSRALAGPIHYADLQDYDYHWMVDTVTEYNEDRDQLNVYDALYRQLGIDPVSIDPKFKRPTVVISEMDGKHLDSLYFAAWSEKRIDLRSTPYYVIAPLANSSLRSLSYTQWLHIITNTLSKGPVVLVGHLHADVPTTDMDVGTFYQHVNQIAADKEVPLFNLIGMTGVRLVAALIKNARAVICLDSGPLYIAQGLRTPCVSLWGTHDPSVRLGYDHDYMATAIFKKSLCPAAPCFAYDALPIDKCPRGPDQQSCEVLSGVSPQDVMEKLEDIDSINQGNLVIRR